MGCRDALGFITSMCRVTELLALPIARPNSNSHRRGIHQVLAHSSRLPFLYPCVPGLVAGTHGTPVGSIRVVPLPQNEGGPCGPEVYTAIRRRFTSSPVGKSPNRRLGEFGFPPTLHRRRRGSCEQMLRHRKKLPSSDNVSTPPIILYVTSRYVR